MLSVFCAPSRYVQGRNATGQLPGELIRLGIGGRCLILASPTAFKLLNELWQTAFEKSAIPLDVVLFNGECSRSEIERLVIAARQAGTQTVVGAGGGKVLDTARAVAAILGTPVACCPTTAASDAPCSALSVVYSEEGTFQECLFYPRNPELVLVDTTVIAKAPVRQLISGMGDALATRFEAEASRMAFRANVAGGLSTMAAAAIADLCYRTLLVDGEAAVEAARAGAVTPAFERIVEANTLLSGLGFESGGLALAHSVHNGLTAASETHDCLHGEKVAFGTLVQLVLEGRNSSETNEVLDFCIRVGLPVTLAQLGLDTLSRSLAFAIAEKALAEGETSHNMAFPLSIDSVSEALFAADALGRSRLRFRSETKGN